MPPRIESLTLEHFKGATCPTTIDFDVSKPIVMIFGENGTGKSTIVDAIGFVCNEEFGSIDDRSVSSSKADLVASLGKNADDLKIILIYAGNTWAGTIGHGRKPSSFGTGDKPKAKILRRSQILQIVNSEPKIRYEALRSFIAVPNTEKNEKTLRDAEKSVDDSFNEAVRAAEQAHTQLKNIWELEGKPDSGYFEWATSKSSIDITTLEVSLSEIKSILENITSCTEQKTFLSTAESDYTTAEKNVREAESSLRAVEESMVGHEKDVVSVLKEAKTFFEKHPEAENCPVCETSFAQGQLKSRIEEKLIPLDNLVKMKSAFDTTKKQMEFKGQILNSKRTDLTAKVFALASKVQKSAITEITSLNIDWNSYSEIMTSGDTSNIDSFKELLNKIIVCKSPLDLRHQQDQKILNQFNSIKSQLQTITEKTSQAKKLQSQLINLKKILELVESERKFYVENELTSISGEVEPLYTKIHPDEGLGRVKLFLKPKVIGSLEFTGQFQGKPDIQPQAYYSESHLDTLGVCIFLALAKKYSDDKTVIVLDDVITSIDQPHMTRFMQLFNDEAFNFNQLIITTHYRPWRDRYKYFQGTSSNIQLIELLHWSHPRGIRHTKTKHSVEELVDYLSKDEIDRQAVASKSGILLEGLIDHIALVYNCKLPRKPEPNYTLGELIDSITKKLKTTLKIQKKTDTGYDEILLSSLVDKVASLTWIRNQVGCHFNIPGMEISDSDVKQYGELTVNFATTLMCNECGELPTRDKSGSYWECRCGATRMHPLTMPT